MFTLRKKRDGKEATAVCSLYSHPLGYELRLESGGELLRSQVCRSHQEWFDTKHAWQTSMIEKGWV